VVVLGLLTEHDRAGDEGRSTRGLDPRGFVEPHEDPRDGAGLGTAGRCAGPS